MQDRAIVTMADW